MQDNNNSQIAIENAVRRHAAMVYRLAYARLRNKENADDVFQETFLKFTKKFADGFESDEHEKAWLITTVINSCKDIWRSAFNKRTVSLDAAANVQVFDVSEDVDLLREIAKLSENQRTALHLFYYEDLQISEIARCMNQQESTVRAWLTRSRQRLASALKGTE